MENKIRGEYAQKKVKEFLEDLYEKEKEDIAQMEKERKE